MNELHLFAGAGGGILGGMLLGHTTVCAVEFDKHAQKVLLARQRDRILPRFPIWGDITTFNGTPWKGRVDIVCGGFPCQDISSAGKGAGITGERSGLWKHMARVINEIRPKFVFSENSPLLVDRGLATVLCDIATMGYDARWCILGANDLGGHHIRKRCWVLAYPSKIGRLRGESHEIDRCYSPQGGLPAKILQIGWNGGAGGLYWESEPKLGRVADGFSCGVDRRLNRIGNAQVPAVAALAFRILSSNLSESA